MQPGVFRAVLQQFLVEAQRSPEIVLLHRTTCFGRRGQRDRGEQQQAKRGSSDPVEARFVSGFLRLSLSSISLIIRKMANPSGH